jgi:predicted LPLAT superfamily acyltransferase
MRKLLDQKKSAMLVGAHLGSFDMLRVVAREANIPVNVIMHVRNSKMINEAFEILDPDSMVRVINLEPNSVQAAFELRRCVERGEFIAVLADRVAPGTRRRVTRARFLGEEAPFPEGPFLLPLLMEIPTILVVALKTGPRKYEVFMEAISNGSFPRPVDRKKLVSEQIQHFASRLEHYCLREPNQWFNFFDFWVECDDAEN